MPEPPSLDGGLISPAAVGIIPLSEPRAVPIAGEPGAATPGSVVRVLNLDLDPPSVSASAASDGSFSTTVLASDGNELRFQAVQQGVRSAPVDFIFSSEGGDQLTPSPRHDCITLEPGFDLDVGSGAATLRIQSSCPDAVRIDSPRFRVGGSFELVTPLPIIVTNAEATLEFRLANTAAPASEDILFVDVTTGARTLRYPIGLFAAEE
jgi:hypothetical protein